MHAPTPSNLRFFKISMRLPSKSPTTNYDVNKQFRAKIGAILTADNETAEFKLRKIAICFQELKISGNDQLYSTCRLSLKKLFEGHQWQLNVDVLSSVLSDIAAQEKKAAAQWFRCAKWPNCKTSFPSEMFPCTTCGDVFEHPTFVQLHMISTHKAVLKTNLTCENECKKCFGNDLKGFVNHLKQKHLCNVAHRKCPVGCRVLVPGNSVQIIEDHVAKNHACTICNEITQDLHRHGIIFHGRSRSLGNDAILNWNRGVSRNRLLLKNSVRIFKKKTKKFETAKFKQKLAASLCKKAASLNQVSAKMKSLPHVKLRPETAKSKTAKIQMKTSKKFVKCSFCNFDIPVKAFNCPISNCLESFDYRFYVYHHLYSFHGEQIEMKFKCELCGIDLIYSDMNVHMNKEHFCLSAHIRCPLECTVMFECELELTEHLHAKHGMFGGLTQQEKSTRSSEISTHEDTDQDTYSFSQNIAKITTQSNVSSKDRIAEPRNQFDEVEKPSMEYTPPELLTTRKRKLHEISQSTKSDKRSTFPSDINQNELQVKTVPITNKTCTTSMEDTFLKKVLETLQKLGQNINLGKPGYIVRIYGFLSKMAASEVEKSLVVFCQLCHFKYPRSFFSCERSGKKLCTMGSFYLHKTVNYQQFSNKYSCYCCPKSKSFKSADDLIDHELENVCEMHFQCPYICPNLLNSENHLASHIYASHFEEFESSSIVPVNKPDVILLSSPESSPKTCSPISPEIVDITPVAKRKHIEPPGSPNIEHTNNMLSKYAKSNRSNMNGFFSELFATKPSSDNIESKTSKCSLVKKKAKEKTKKETASLPFYSALVYFTVIQPLNDKLTSGCLNCNRVKPSLRYYKCKLCRVNDDNTCLITFALYLEAAVHLERVHFLNVSGINSKCDNATCRVGSKRKKSFTKVQKFYEHIVQHHGLCRKHFVCPKRCGSIFNLKRDFIVHLKTCQI